jgi:hypothetical protein
MRMREDLLAHLEAIVEDERLHGRAEADAVQHALCRLGYPEELRLDLQQSLTTHERYTAWINSWFERRRGEAPFRLAIRVSLQISLLLAALLLPILAIQSLAGVARPAAWMVGPATLMIISAASLSITWLGVFAGDRLMATWKPAWRTPLVWIAAGICGAVVTLLGSMALVAVSGEARLPADALRPWLWLGLATVVAFVGVVEAWQRERRLAADWERLPIDTEVNAA